jgi:hypothetical protein
MIVRGLGLVYDTPPCCGPFKLDTRSGVCIDAVGTTPSFSASSQLLTSSFRPTPYAGEVLDPNWMSCLRTIPGTGPIATDPSINWSTYSPYTGVATPAAVPVVSNSVSSIPTWGWVVAVGVGIFLMGKI